MKNKIIALFLIPLVFSMTGCATKKLSMSEEADWGSLLNQNVVQEPLLFKSVKGTGVWDFIIPGSGSAYAGGGESFGWLGAILLWPISPFYQPAIGVSIARSENKRRTIEYYKFGSHQNKLGKLKADGKLPADFIPRDSANVQFGR